jgi:uncharacterized protein (DUF1684 family)
MKPKRFTLALGFALSVMGFMTGARADSDSDLARENAQWREQRTRLLTRSDGWLTLIGLHFLQPGANRVGHATDNDVVLTAGPAHFGTVDLAPNGELTFTPAIESGQTVSIDGQPGGTGSSVPLKTDVAGRPTVITAGTVSFFAIDRDRRKALRVRDSASPDRSHFAGLNYFPFESAWRIEARWVPFRPPQVMPITNVLGQTTNEKVPGKAVFEHDGKVYELRPILETPAGPLFFVISDATSGHETYAASRFLYALLPQDGKVILDFNQAENPPCAFTSFATCPLPPKENRLPFPILAGEKAYVGHADK